ncbi:MAG: hypothetical protein AAF497_08070 [Planctomycetota bacterium]
MLANLINSLVSGQSNFQKPTASLFSGFELLESRQMMAGDVTVAMSASGNMTLTGDNAGNIVRIEAATAGRIRVMGQSGTQIVLDGIRATSQLISIDGATTVDGVTNLKGNLRINMRGGNDRVYLDNVDVERNLNASMGTGHDQLRLDNSRVQRGLTFLGGVGASDDVLAIRDSNVTGTTRATFGQSSFSDYFHADDVSFEGNVIVSQTSGSATVIVENTSVEGRLTVNTGAASDYLSSFNLLAGQLSVSTGAGNDNIEIYETDSQRTATITSGSGHDRLVINDAIFHSHLNINTGLGDDEVEFEDVSTIGNLRLVTGSGDDGVQFTNHYFLGSAYFSLGGGDDDLDFDDSNTAEGPFRVIGGAGFDTVHDPSRLTSRVDPVFSSIEWITEF